MKNKYNIVIIAGVVFLVIIIVYIISMFGFDNNKNNNKAKNGYYIVEPNMKNILKDYATDILIEISNGNSDKLWELTDKNFLEIYKLSNKEELLKYLQDEGLGMLTNVIVSEYKSYKYEGNDVHIISLKDTSDEELLPITIIESSPRVYTIAFDKFITGDANKRVVKSNNTEMTINNMSIYERMVKFDVKILNTSDKDIDVQLDFDKNNIKLNYQDKEIYEMHRTFNSKNNIIKTKNSVNKKITFYVPLVKYSDLNSLIITNVLVDGVLVEEIYNLK